MNDAMSIAARLLHQAPANVGDSLPTWAELERIGDLMTVAGRALRKLHDVNRDLLAACKAALEEAIVGIPSRAADPIIRILEAAIDKAEGRS